MIRKVLQALREQGIDIQSSHRRSAGNPFEVQQRLLAGQEVKTILDCGAHHGDMAKNYRRRFPGAKVYCFEPTPATFSALKAATAGDPMIEPVNAAIGEKPGRATLTVYDDETSNSLMGGSAVADGFGSPMPAPSSTVDVDVQTIDGFCEQRGIKHVDVVKIDIEGLEVPAFRGAERLLKDQAIDVILSEFRIVSSFEGGTTLFSLGEFLAKYGYLVFGFYTLMYEPNLRLDWGDVVFVSERCYRRYREACASANGR